MRPFLLQRRPLTALLVALLISLGVAACHRGEEKQATVAPVAAPALASSLRVVLWDDYITPEVAADVERDLGVKLELDFVNNNEEVIARLQQGEVWDLWTPSDYAVHLASDLGLLAPLDHERLPNLKNVGRRFQNAIYDREFRYSVPYYWGTTGLGYDRQAFASPPASWGVLFDPAQRSRHKGKMSMLADGREALSAALIYLGHDPNTTEDGQLAAARDLLIAAKRDLAAFDSENYEDNLASGNLDLVMGWSGDIAQVVAENPQRGYVLPAEGFMLFIDNFAIPAASTKKDTALAVLNYILQPEVAGKLSTQSRNPTTLPDARPFIPQEILDSASFQLPEAAKFHPFFYLGEEGTEKTEKAWNEVLAAR